MPGLGPGIHELRRKMLYPEALFLLRSTRLRGRNSWMPGPRPGMTNGVRMDRDLCSGRLNLTPMGLGPGIHESGMTMIRAEPRRARRTALFSALSAAPRAKTRGC